MKQQNQSWVFCQVKLDCVINAQVRVLTWRESMWNSSLSAFEILFSPLNVGMPAVSRIPAPVQLGQHWQNYHVTLLTTDNQNMRWCEDGLLNGLHGTVCLWFKMYGYFKHDKRSVLVQYVGVIAYKYCCELFVTDLSYSCLICFYIITFLRVDSSDSSSIPTPYR